MKIEFECPCGEATRWRPNQETEDDAHLTCENCESRYAISFTRIVDGNTA